ncbi:MAG: carbohydrate-binding domain-containing protein, partial [Oscillospiraceae bacterium]|nr:carbohydrate-binding domain-containing protein [Oscillospiraceae bacterium]
MNKTGLILSWLILSSLTACSNTNTNAVTESTTETYVSSASSTSQTTEASSDGPVLRYPDTGAVSAGNEPTVTKAHIRLSDSGITIQGSGASEDGSTLVISEGGSYEITGSMTGQIYVAAPKDEEVELVLDNVTVKGSENTGSPLFVRSADKVTVKMKKDTVNTFTDTAKYTLSGDDELTACIYSKDDITFKGKGALIISGNYKNGIYSKNDVRIKGGDITITAVNDGITGKDSVRTEGGTVRISSGGNGIVSSNDGEDGRGLVAITGGTVDITSGGTDGSTAVCGVKAAQAVQMGGGMLIVNSSGDGIHSSGTFTADGGEFSITSGDDAVHADGDITLNDGVGMIINS